MVRPNSYQKKPAPMFGGRFTTGDPDYNNLSFWQHWVQTNWQGGNAAARWADNEMFDQGVGVDTTLEQKLQLSPELRRGTGANWALGGAQANGFRFITYGQTLYAYSVSTTATMVIYSYNTGTDAWTAKTAPVAGMKALDAVVFDGKLWLVGQNAAGAAPLAYYTTDATTWTLQADPAGPPGTKINAVAVLKDKLYADYNGSIWRLSAAGGAWDGAAEFYSIKKMDSYGQAAAMAVHLEFLYILTYGGVLHRTDGSTSFQIWAFDGLPNSVSMRSFDGRLFIYIQDYDSGYNNNECVMYQFSGSAVTEIKRWGLVGKLGAPSRDFAIHKGKLYYGVAYNLGQKQSPSGFGVAVYDPVEDAHSEYAVQLDTATYTEASFGWHVVSVVVYGGSLFAVTRAHGAFRTALVFEGETQGNGWFAPSGNWYSSDYSAGTPGLQKLWQKVTVTVDLPTSTCGLVLRYSTDAGATWIDLAANGRNALDERIGPSSGAQIFDLPNLRSERLKLRLTLRNNIVTATKVYTPIVSSIIVSYLPQPEPNWMWTFTVAVTDSWKLMDGTTETKSVNTLVSYLMGLFRARALVNFVDVDGTSWATGSSAGVLIHDMTTVHYLLDASAREGDIRITLLEAVESY